MKQMKIIHSNGFTRKELSSFKVGKRARAKARAHTHTQVDFA